MVEFVDVFVAEIVAIFAAAFVGNSLLDGLRRLVLRLWAISECYG
jgi:hypothetical protein